MLFSRLVYECVKDSINSPEHSLSYTDFIKSVAKGDYIGKQWAMQSTGVFRAINLAMARLMTYEKIPFSTDEVTFVDGECDFNEGKVVNVFVETDKGYIPLRFTNKNRNSKIKVFGYSGEAYIEYRKDIPHFTTEIFQDVREEDVGITLNKDIDLKSEYGVTDQMCEFIMEFVKAQLLETFAPELGNNHATKAEQYFDSLEVYSTAHYQDSVQDVMGEYYL